ncbi:MAG TPA: tetratricopeptide repeat protein, partial [Tepidisphaeraceae bacterium]|nr:tetratricopeptide repeat protein [Tepidisphaeraceae bacterium]
MNDPKLAPAIGAAVIIIATLLAYLPAMKGDFVWDDDYYVSNNHLLANFDGLQKIWFGVLPHPSEYALPQYYPLTYTSFWIEYHIWGLNPHGFHVVNVVLHLCSAMLIWLILKKLDVPGAWLAAAIFALHPINVESVAWIAERKNVLSMLFFLSSLYVYLRYARIIKGSQETLQATPQANQLEWFKLPDEPARLYALAAVLFLCALFSKTIASSMPAVALLIIWWKRGKITLKDAMPLLPLFIVGFDMGLLTAYMEKMRVGVAMRPGDWIYASTPLGQFGAKCIIAGKAIWFYLLKLIFPHPLIFNYPRWMINPADPMQYLFPASVIVVLILLALSRKRLGNGVLVAALFYLITLFPAMGFIDVWPMRYSFVADHFVYLSNIGMIALIAAIAATYLSRAALTGLAGVLIVLMSIITFNQAELYKNLKTLWEKTLIQTHQKSWFAMNNYGVWIRDESSIRDPYIRLDDAEKWFNKVIALKPDHPEARLNLAVIAEQRAELAKIDQANKIPTTLPSKYQEQAIDFYRQALALAPNYIDAHYFLGKLLESMGRDNEATEQFRQTIAFYPRHELAREHLAALLIKQGKIDEAIQQLADSVETNPDSITAHKSLGTALLKKGDVVNGLGEWEQAMRLAPQDWTLPNGFGIYMFQSGENAKAVDYFQQA